MDPFSLTVGIFSLIGACTATSRTFIGLRALKHAPALLQALNNEIVDLQLVLVDIKGYLDRVEMHETDGISASTIRKGRLLIEQTRGKVQEVDMLIQYEVLKPGREESFEVNRIAFLREQSHLRQLQQDLRYAKQQITDLFNQNKIREASNILTDIRLLGNQAHDDLLAGLSMLSSGQARIEETLHYITTRTDSSNRPLSPTYSSHTSQLATSPIHPKQTIEIQLAHVGHALRTPRYLFKRHSHFLQASLGRLFIAYTNMPTFQCDSSEYFCHHDRTAGLTVSYFFPARFLFCVIVFHIQLTQAFELTWSLAVRQIVSEDHLIWKYMRLDDLNGMKKLLSSRRVSIYAKNTSGHGLLNQALLMGNCQSVKFLLQSGADSYSGEKEGIMPPYRMAWSHILSPRRPSQLRDALRSLFPQPDFDDLFGFSPLHKTVLGFAGYYWPTTCNAENLNAVDYDGQTPLYWAIKMGICKTTERLLAAGADYNKVDNVRKCPLHMAIHACLHCMELLLRAGADVDARNQHSSTVLHYAAAANAAYKPLNFTVTLVDAGAEINAENQDGRTALDYALEEGNQDVAEYLIKRGADPDLRDRLGNNALCWATRGNCHSVIELLLHAGQDHCQHIQRIRTFMHLAAEAADVKTLQLLAHGCLKRRDINIKNEDGMTPIQVAIHRTDVDAEWREAFVNFLKAVDEDEPQGQKVTELQDASNKLGTAASSTSLEEEFEDAVEAQA